MKSGIPKLLQSKSAEIMNVFINIWIINIIMIILTTDDTIYNYHFNHYNRFLSVKIVL